LLLCKKKGCTSLPKLGSDANLKYMFKGKQKPGRGRNKLYDGKINTSKIDKRPLPCCYADEDMKVYAGQVYCVLLKQTGLAGFIYYNGKEKPEIIISTDTEMEVMRMCKYYGLRFQVEFLIGDAKQFTGLGDCMARDEQKLHTHFNIALTVVSVAKAAYYLSEPKQQRGSFLMADIKMLHMKSINNRKNFFKLRSAPELQKNKTYL
jgi:hypothetical protein